MRNGYRKPFTFRKVVCKPLHSRSLKSDARLPRQSLVSSPALEGQQEEVIALQIDSTPLRLVASLFSFDTP